jgi:DNA-binding response OmpR family regulator
MEEICPKILLVEDDEDTRLVYTTIFNLEGMDVTGVSTKAAGLYYAQSEEFDLIVLDVRLPDGDGVELCREIREFNDLTPILFVSAAAYEKDILLGLEAGAQAYLTKPTDTDKLVETVRGLLKAPIAVEAPTSSSR